MIKSKNRVSICLAELSINKWIDSQKSEKYSMAL